MLRRLRQCRKGATIVEFALVAPMFLMVLLGTIDAARMFWMRKTLGEVAFSTVRCMSISSTCDTTAKQRSYAVARARGYGVRVTSANVTPQTAVICRNRANSNSVSVQAPFASALGGILPLPGTLRATACFPVLS